MHPALKATLFKGVGVPSFRADLLAGTYQQGGGAVPAATIMSGSPRRETDAWSGQPWGARVESAGQNLCYSTAFQGAVLGAVGSGGAIPTDWHTANSISGLVVTVDAINGEEIDLTVAGVAGGSGAWILQFEPITTAVCASGEVFTGSVEVQLLAATTGVVEFASTMIERTNVGGFVAVANQTFVPQSDILFPVEQRRTIGTGVRLNHGISLVAVSGQTVNAKLRLRRPQLEKRAYRSSFMPSATGTGSRTADALAAVTVPGLAAGFVTGFRAGCAASGTIRQIDDGSDANGVVVYLENYLVKLDVRLGGVVVDTLTLGRALRWGAMRVAFSLSPIGVSASLSGKPVQTSAQIPAVPTRDRFGVGIKGALEGWIGEVATYGTDISSRLRDLSRPTLQFWDDFDRANGALVAPWTGQTYEIVPLGDNPSVVEMQISGGKAVTPDGASATDASYTGVAAPSVPVGFRCSLAFNAGVGGGSAVLIANPNGLATVSQITSRSLHMVYQPDQVDFGLFEAGVYPTPAIQLYASAMTADGLTRYDVGWRKNGDGVVAELPDGTLSRKVNPDFAIKAGRFMTFEGYVHQSGAVRPDFYAVQGEWS